MSKSTPLRRDLSLGSPCFYFSLLSCFFFQELDRENCCRNIKELKQCVMNSHSAVALFEFFFVFLELDRENCCKNSEELKR